MATQTKQRKQARGPKVKIGESRQIVIPKKLYEELDLAAGDYLEVARKGERLVLTPQMFIEKHIAEGLADIEAGRVSGPFKSAKEAIRALRA